MNARVIITFAFLAACKAPLIDDRSLSGSGAATSQTPVPQMNTTPQYSNTPQISYTPVPTASGTAAAVTGPKTFAGVFLTNLTGQAAGQSLNATGFEMTFSGGQVQGIPSNVPYIGGKPVSYQWTDPTLVITDSQNVKLSFTISWLSDFQYKSTAFKCEGIGLVGTLGCSQVKDLQLSGQKIRN